MRIAALTRIVLLGSALCHGVAGTARAQDSAQPTFAFREQLTPFTDQVRQALGSDHARFTATLDELVDQEADQRALRAEVGFGFSANEAGDFSGVGPGNDTLFRLATSAELGRGTYPSAFRLTADVNAQMRNNVFEQKCPKLLTADFKNIKSVLTRASPTFTCI